MKINDLRNKLIEQVEKLETGKVPIELAREVSRTSQAILDSVRLEIEYNKQIKRKNKIDFLESE